MVINMLKILELCFARKPDMYLLEILPHFVEIRQWYRLQPGTFLYKSIFLASSRNQVLLILMTLCTSANSHQFYTCNCCLVISFTHTSRNLYTFTVPTITTAYSATSLMRQLNVKHDVLYDECKPFFLFLDFLVLSWAIARPYTFEIVSSIFTSHHCCIE